MTGRRRRMGEFGRSIVATACVIGLSVSLPWPVKAQGSPAVQAIADDIATLRDAHASPVAASDALAELAKRRYGQEDLPGARAALDAAVALNASAAGETDPQRALALARALGTRARLNHEAGDYLAAIADAERALELRRAQPDPDPAEIATLIYDQGRAHDGRGDHEKTEAAALESYEIRRAHFGQVHEKTADSLNLYANALAAQGRHAEADPAYRQVLGMYEVLYGPKDWHVAIVLSNLGNSLRRTGRASQAAPLYRRAVAIAEISADKVLLAQCLNNYGWFLHLQGDGRKAEAQFRRAQDLVVPLIGDSHAFVGVLRANIGYALLDQDRAAEAEVEFERGLALLEQGMGAESPDLLDTLAGAASTQAALGRFAEAEALHKRMSLIAAARLAPAHPEGLKGGGAYAAFLLERDRPGDALNELRTSLGPLTSRTSGGRDWRVAVRGARPLFARRVEAGWRLAAQPAAVSTVSAPDRSSTP